MTDDRDTVEHLLGCIINDPDYYHGYDLVSGPFEGHNLVDLAANHYREIKARAEKAEAAERIWKLMVVGGQVAHETS